MLDLESQLRTYGSVLDASEPTPADVVELPAARRHRVAWTVITAVIVVIVMIAVVAPPTFSHRPRVNTGPPPSSGPQLPPRVLQWLRDYNAHSSPRGSSADWVLTTAGKTAPLMSGAAPNDPTPVYLFDVHGSFVWDHSCPPGAPPSACVSRGTHEMFTLDARKLQIGSYGIQQNDPNLAQFGRVGHVQL
jgi:hypothetical protein